MRRVIGELVALTLAVAALPGLAPAARAALQGVRVVDSVSVSVPLDESAHGLQGEAMAVGKAADRKWRSATGWFSYTLRIYDDTPVTVVCAFVDSADAREAFDILIDERKPAARAREARRANTRELTVTLPLTETAGKTQVTVTFRAHAGSHTARLLDVRTVQEHLE